MTLVYPRRSRSTRDEGARSLVSSDGPGLRHRGPGPLSLTAGHACLSELAKLGVCDPKRGVACSLHTTYPTLADLLLD